MTHSDTAHKLVLGDRNADYGNPHADFAGVALIWSGILNAKLKDRITPTEVALMMTGLKLRRHAHKPKDDNLIDAHGYLTCAEWIERGERPVPYSEELTNEALQLAEVIATGGRLTCPSCEKTMPCMCDHK